jgi:hypothetical protein
MQILQCNQWSSIVIAKNNLKSFLLLKDTMAKIQQPPVLPTNRETKQGAWRTFFLDDNGYHAEYYLPSVMLLDVAVTP